jgi:hypothetical protein
MSSPVGYDDFIPIINIAPDETIGWNGLQKLFCAKLKDWEYEQEYRLLVSAGKYLEYSEIAEKLQPGYSIPEILKHCLPYEKTLYLIMEEQCTKCILKLP